MNDSEIDEFFNEEIKVIALDSKEVARRAAEELYDSKRIKFK